MDNSYKPGFGLNIRVYTEEFHSPSASSLYLFGSILTINSGKSSSIQYAILPLPFIQHGNIKGQGTSLYWMLHFNEIIIKHPSKIWFCVGTQKKLQSILTNVSLNFPLVFIFLDNLSVNVFSITLELTTVTKRGPAPWKQFLY